MTRKAVPDYPGKPGPKPTGLKRKILFPFALSQEEWEYLERLERDGADQKPKLKKAHIIRKRTFHSGWLRELEEMRRHQGANIRA